MKASDTHLHITVPTSSPAARPPDRDAPCTHSSNIRNHKTMTFIIHRRIDAYSPMCLRVAPDYTDDDDFAQ